MTANEFRDTVSKISKSKRVSLTLWCRPNQFDCQSYLVNYSSLFNQSRCVFHLDLYLGNYFFLYITKLPFRTINHSTQRKKKDLAKQTVQVIFSGSFVDGSGKLTCSKIINTVLFLILEPPSGIKFKAGLIWKNIVWKNSYL